MDIAQQLDSQFATPVAAANLSVNTSKRLYTVKDKLTIQLPQNQVVIFVEILSIPGVTVQQEMCSVINVARKVIFQKFVKPPVKCVQRKLDIAGNCIIT